MDIKRNLDQASTDIENVITGQEKELNEDAHIQHIHVPKASWADFRSHFGQLQNFKLLFSATYLWFAFDIGLKTLSNILSKAHSPHRLPSMASHLTLESSYKPLVLVVPSPRIKLLLCTRI